MAADAAVSFAVKKLGDAIIHKVIFLKGVEKDVVWLRDELQSMQCFLRDAAAKQAPAAADERTRKWISDVREVAHDAEDAIDTFVINVENPRRERGFAGSFCGGDGGCSPLHICHRNRVGKKIRAIKKRLEHIRSRLQTYGVQNLGCEGPPSAELWRRRWDDVERRRRLVCWEKDKDVVGLNEDVELLLEEWVLDGEKKGLSVGAIVGMGGIGKSTLARKIYDDPAVAAAGFDCRAWVVVSSEFTAEDIFKQIMVQLHISFDHGRLKGVESIKDKLMREQMLRDALCKHLEGKRYFIVLDDVWEEAHWESFGNAFCSQQDKASRLLLTSRNKVTAKYAQYVHKMQLLDHKKSWELLLNKAFINNKTTEGGCIEELEPIGRKILNKCGGLPLAINVVGGLLLNQSKNGWEKILKGIDFHLRRDEKYTISVSAILELSYQHLSPQMKSCFLCLAFFKEDAIINAKRLIDIWVALGLVQQQGEETIEEIARSYLDELINRNLVQIKDTDVDDQVRTCHVHDLLRELCIDKAKEEIGFKILKGEERINISSKSLYKPRHLVVECNDGRLTKFSLNQNKHLRSLFLHSKGYGDVYFSTTSRFLPWKNFELLKILDIEGIRMQRLPDSFRALIGLKSLRLRTGAYCEALKLPIWFDRLEKLEILDVDYKEVRLPNVRLKMDKLRHFTAWCITRATRIDTWKNLETLKFIKAEDWLQCSPTAVASLRRLRKLGIKLQCEEIETETEISKVRASLEKMENLAQLHLIWDGFAAVGAAIPRLKSLTKLKLSGYMTEFPCVSMFPQNISRFTLDSASLYEDPMPVLGELRKLVHLKLDYAYRRDTMRVLHDGFPSLKALSLRVMGLLRFIDVEEGGMPQLKRMEIHKCPSFEMRNMQERLTSAAISTY